MAGSTVKEKWIADLISETEITQISEAIAIEEKKTSGEIVTMIVRRSSVLGHVPLALTLFIYVLFLVFELPNHSYVSEQGNYWVILIAAAVLYALSFVIAKLDIVQRALTPVGDQMAQVERRAMLEFYQAGIQGTAEATGILIFISLFERRVVVLADKAIAAKLPQDTWNEMCRSLVANIKQKRAGVGIVEAVKSCGKILSHHFPLNAEDVNELPNQLVIKE